MAARTWVSLLFLSLVLAGCAKGGPEEVVPTSTNLVQGSGEALPDAGSIEGIVVDDSVLPIAGVVVALQEIEGVATTDEAGRFAFTNLAPGSYIIQAAKLGFSSSSQRVEVLANEAVAVTVTLAPITIAQPYVDMRQFGLHMSCGEGLVVVTATGGFQCAPFGEGNVTADHDGVVGDIRSIIGELVWVANSGLSSREMILTFGINETGGPTGNTPSFNPEYDSQTGPSPVTVRKDAPFKGLEDLPDEEAFVRYRLWVPYSTSDLPIVVLVVDQRFDLFSSVFHGEEAPEDYSAIPDA